MKSSMHLSSERQTMERVSAFFRAALFVAILSAPNLLFAQDSFGGACDRVSGFFEDISGLLNMASLAVITIAIIFAGYQIAFAHKRISEVAPILVGALLIGGSAQIAKMLLLDDSGDTVTGTCAMVVNTAQHLA